MAAIAFDTLKFSRKLEAAGFTPAQAQGASEAFAEATGDQLVTKGDLREELSPLKTEMAQIKADISILKWMNGFTLAAIMAIFYLLLKQH